MLETSFKDAAAHDFTCRLSPHSDTCGITTERGDVCVHPFKGSSLIEESYILIVQASRIRKAINAGQLVECRARIGKDSVVQDHET